MNTAQKEDSSSFAAHHHDHEPPPPPPPPRPEHVHYDNIERFFLDSLKYKKDFLFHQDRFDEELWLLEEKYNVPYEALLSFLRNMHVLHIKKTAPSVKNNMAHYLRQYCDNNDDGTRTRTTTILSLAQSANYPPFLLARFLVEHLTTIPKTQIGQAVSNAAKFVLPSVIVQPNTDNYGSSSNNNNATDERSSTFATRFVQDLNEATEMDPFCGPRHDLARRMVGVEYEVVLEMQLSAMGIPFESEANLRARGTSRTPDVLLQTPLAIHLFDSKRGEWIWKLITWIDSKALFGDVDTHNHSVVPQAESYIHRFGPGLILYWFGHAPHKKLNDLVGEIAITGWELPSKFMLPDGKIVQWGER